MVYYEFLLLSSILIKWYTQAYDLVITNINLHTVIDVTPPRCRIGHLHPGLKRRYTRWLRANSKQMRTEIVFRIGEKVRGNSMSFEILVRHRYWQTRGCLQSPGPETNTCLSWNVNGYHIPVGSERQIVRRRSKIHREITFFQAQRVWITLCTEIRNMPRWTDLLLHLISFQEDSINKQDALQLC